MPNTGRLASPSEEIPLESLVESPDKDSYQKIYAFLNGLNESKSTNSKNSHNKSSIVTEPARPVSQAGNRKETNEPIKQQLITKVTNYTKLQNKRSKSSAAPSMNVSTHVHHTNTDSISKIYGGIPNNSKCIFKILLLKNSK